MMICLHLEYTGALGVDHHLRTRAWRVGLPRVPQALALPQSNFLMRQRCFTGLIDHEVQIIVRDVENVFIVYKGE